MGKVIGLLTWGDFVEEIRRAQPRAIRVQAYHITCSTEPPIVEFFLDAAFVDGDEILLARFPLGREIQFFLEDDPCRREQFRQRMRIARETVQKALAALGVEVRPGVYVEAREARLATDPAGLWRFEKDGEALRLVPEIPVEAAA
ncbi:hypothetical protein [Thermoflexus hugenholtzii]